MTTRDISAAIQEMYGAEGKKECLGMWLSETEGAKFWMSVLTELQNRGLQDIIIACVDGLSGYQYRVPEDSSATPHRSHGT